MKLDQVRLREDAEMARRIQALLAFKEQHIDSTMAAQVIGSSGSDQSRVLYIDKGSNDGLARDMAVITPSGIVGKIVQVFPDSAQVLPINDQLSGVGVALNSRLQGTLKGAADGTVTVQYIMSDEKVDPGEEVVTTGGDRIFPRGLPVGTVTSAQPGKDLFFTIQVKPAADLNRLDEVLVVTKISERAPDTKDLGPIRASDILAQRLPGVPDKSQVDAKGNAVQPGTAPATAATNPAGGTAALGNPSTRPAGTGTTVAKPGTAAASAAQTAPGAKPAGTAAQTTGTKPFAPGTKTATAGGTAVATKPATTGSTGANAKPSGGDTTGNTSTSVRPPSAGTAGGTSARSTGRTVSPSTAGNNSAAASNAASGSDKPADSGTASETATPKPVPKPTVTTPPSADTTQPTTTPPAAQPPQQ
jgi:rod shape-determining protein MreC